jgi:hypothetical protein
LKYKFAPDKNGKAARVSADTKTGRQKIFFIAANEKIRHFY